LAKDREIDRLNTKIKNMKDKASSPRVDTIDSVIEQVTKKENPKDVQVNEVKDDKPDEEEPAEEESNEEESNEEEPDEEEPDEEEPDDKGVLQIVSSRKKQYYIYEKEDPQHVYQYVDEDTIGKIVGLRKKNDKGKYKITMNK